MTRPARHLPRFSVMDLLSLMTIIAIFICGGSIAIRALNEQRAVANYDPWIFTKYMAGWMLAFSSVWLPTMWRLHRSLRSVFTEVTE